MREPLRYLGLDLSGAKNSKTALAAIHYYPRERKIFLLDVYDRVVHRDDQNSDEALLEMILELKEDVSRVGVNVPLVLPPCIPCQRKTCPLPSHCTVPAVKWMRKKTKEFFTPYTQRPIEIWVRKQVLPDLGDWLHFDVDETLGGNKAPLTARMHFLQRHLAGIELVEVWPKLSVLILAKSLGLSRRVITSYRHLELGAHARAEILEKMISQHGVFIYDRDLRKLAQSLTAFDAFFCAYTALLSDHELCVKPPKGFPTATGWVQYPILEA